jgi:glycosyltransferase 2 family protein
MSTRAEDPRSGLVRRMTRSVWARIIVTTALLVIVASQISWRQMAERVRHGHPLDLLAAVILVVVALIIGAYRWWRLLRKADVPLGLSSLVRIYAISIFSNTFLPTTVGGDVTRALLVVRRGPLLTRVATTIVVDRVGALAGLLGMAWISVAFQSATVSHRALVFLAWVTGGMLIGSLLVLTAVLRGSGPVRAVIPRRLISAARQSRLLLRSYVGDPVTLVVLLVLSLIYQALISIQLVVLARAINVHLSFATAAVVLALVTVATLIPISVGGFGVREGSYVVLLGGVSIAATEATLISVLSVVTLFLASLPGAFLLARGGIQPALEAAPS